MTLSLPLNKVRLEHIKQLRRADRVHGGLNKAILSGDWKKIRKWQKIVLCEVLKDD
jgi:hypothetical protein